MGGALLHHLFSVYSLQGWAMLGGVVTGGRGMTLPPLTQCLLLPLLFPQEWAVSGCRGSRVSPAPSWPNPPEVCEHSRWERLTSPYP